MTTTDDLIYAVRLLAQVLNMSGNVEPAEHFARVHDELSAGPDAARVGAIAAELLASSPLAQKHAFDIEARQAFAKVWIAAKAAQTGDGAAS